MKSYLRYLLPILAIAAASALAAADSTVPSQAPFVAPEKGAQPPGRGGPGGPGARGGGRGAAVNAMVDQIDRAVGLTADQKAKAEEIYRQAAEDVRALLTPDQVAKLEAANGGGRGGRGAPGAPGARGARGGAGGAPKKV